MLGEALDMLDVEVLALRPDGTVAYSSLATGRRGKAIERYARKHRAALARSRRAVMHAGGEQVILRSREVDGGGERLLLVVASTKETFDVYAGIEYRNRDEVERAYSQSVMGVVDGTPALADRLTRAYARGATVMLEGEAGTGKTQLAELLYLSGPFAADPFVHVSCEALSDRAWRHLVGASDSPLYQNGLTLYVSGLHALSPLKVRQLLSAMEESAACRRNHVVLSGDDVPGGGESDAVVRAGDALRCAVCVATPVREMPGNAGRVERYLGFLARALELERPGLSAEARAALDGYAWPRNYVQLREVSERLFIASDGGAVGADTVAEVLAQEGVVRHAVAGPSNMEGDLYVLQPLAQTERDIARLVLEHLGGNKTRTAEVLGISRTTLWRLLKDDATAHGIE